MVSSKLILLFKTLSKLEVKELGTYLKRKSGSSFKLVYNLYLYLKKIHPELNDNQLDKEKVFKKISPENKAFNKKMMTDVMSLLNVNLEEFLLEKELKQSEIERSFLMLKILKNRGVDKLFFKNVKQFEKKLSNNPQAGVEQYYYKYKLLNLLYFHPNSSLYNPSGVSLRQVINAIDSYYFVAKLYFSTCEFSQDQILNESGNEQFPNFLIEEISKNISSPLFKDNIHANIFNDFYKSFSNNDYSDYLKFKNNYIAHFDSFNETEQHDLFIHLQSYCYAYHRNTNPENLLQEIFALNKFAVEKKVIIEKNSIATDVFRNIVQFGCVTKEFEWTENFIAENNHYLSKDIKENIVLLCKSNLCFYKGEFEDTLSNLIQVHYDDVFIGIQVRCMQLQCYFELENYDDAFYNLLNAFTVFLSRRKDIAPSVTEMVLNFLKIVKKMYDQKNAPVKKIEPLAKRINDSNNIANKKWLLEKIQEMSSK